MHSGGNERHNTRKVARRAAGVIAVVAALAGAGTAAAREDVAAVPMTTTTAPSAPAPSASASATAPAPVIARYAFDRAGSDVADETGLGHTLRRLARNGGATRFVKHGSGLALAFPKKCSATAKCPKAVLQSAAATDLNPDDDRLGFGASVRLAKGQTTHGQNVVQKGFSASGSQYKLQIDGAAGKPSCVVVDVTNPAIRMVRSSVTVADNAWHVVECHRVGASLTIVVDGVQRGALAIPEELSIANNVPLSVGGKGTFRDNDQFQGMVDDIWVSIG
jgi:hypothetical protein